MNCSNCLHQQQPRRTDCYDANSCRVSATYTYWPTLLYTFTYVAYRTWAM